MRPIDRQYRWWNRAKNPETRASIRRWSRVQNLAIGMALTGIVLPIGTVAVVALVPRPNSDQGIGPVLGWTIGGGLALFVVAAFLESEAQDRIRAARFAGGHRSAGMVDFVNEEPPSEVGGRDTFTLVISAGIPGQVRIHRRLYSQDYPQTLTCRSGR